MKAKVTTIANGKVTNHRGFVDAETWIPGKVEFLKNITSLTIARLNGPKPDSLFVASVPPEFPEPVEKQWTLPIFLPLLTN